MKDYLIFVAKCGFVGVVIGTAFAIMSLEKRIERLEDQLGLMRVTYIYTTNGIAEIATGFTIEQASNLYEVLRKVQAEREQPKFTNSTSITISTWTNLPNTGIRAKEDKP